MQLGGRVSRLALDIGRAQPPIVVRWSEGPRTILRGMRGSGGDGEVAVAWRFRANGLDDESSRLQVPREPVP